jgi:hypothetical protein
MAEGETARKRKYRLLPARRPAAGAAGPEPGRSEGERLDGELLAWQRFGKPRRELVAEAAYYRSLLRTGGARDADADWIEAEVEIDRMLAGLRSAAERDAH